MKLVSPSAKVTINTPASKLYLVCWTTKPTCTNHSNHKFWIHSMEKPHITVITYVKAHASAKLSRSYCATEQIYWLEKRHVKHIVTTRSSMHSPHEKSSFPSPALEHFIFTAHKKFLPCQIREVLPAIFQIRSHFMTIKPLSP